jgi:hypothetical protein
MAEPFHSFSVSPALLSAALGGLLCVASSACGGSTAPSPGSANMGGAGASASASGTADSSGSAGSAAGSSSVAAVNPDTPVPDTTCDGGVVPNPQITASAVDALTLDQFTARCQTVNGILEIQPHCSGSNACRGFSYDSETQVLVEHTCRGMNSCAGFSCVVCD